MDSDVELGVVEDCLWQTAGIFLRNNNIVVLRKLCLNDYREVFVVVGTCNYFVDLDTAGRSECADVVDKAVGGSESANDGGGEWITRNVICYGFNGELDIGCLGA